LYSFERWSSSPVRAELVALLAERLRLLLELRVDLLELGLLVLELRLRRLQRAALLLELLVRDAQLFALRLELFRLALGLLEQLLELLAIGGVAQRERDLVAELDLHATRPRFGADRAIVARRQHRDQAEHREQQRDAAEHDVRRARHRRFPLGGARREQLALVLEHLRNHVADVLGVVAPTLARARTAPDIARCA